jgi:hypothetical protein
MPSGARLDWHRSSATGNTCFRLAHDTIIEFETSKRATGPDFVAAIRAALESAGVIFVDENGEVGVMMSKAK